MTTEYVVNEKVKKYFKNKYSELYQVYEKVFINSNLLGCIDSELNRQSRGVNLIASESIPSQEVLLAFASLNHLQTIEGNIGQRWFPFTDAIDELETETQKYAMRVFNLDYANVQPHSATQANQAVYLSSNIENNSILSLSFLGGGHLSHGFKSSFANRFSNVVTYEPHSFNDIINYDEIEFLVNLHRPKLIISGASAYPRNINFSRVSEIAKKYGSLHLADISHVAGFVATNLMCGVDSADFVTFSLHKSLCGPRGGIILANKKHRSVVNSSLFPGSQGAFLPNLLAAKNICLKNIQSKQFHELQSDIVVNARAIARAITEDGLNIYTGGTDTHIVLVKIPSFYKTQKVFERLIEAGVLCNINYIIGDSLERKEASGIRFGTIWITQLGFSEELSYNLGKIIVDIIHNRINNLKARNKISEIVNSCF